MLEFEIECFKGQIANVKKLINEGENNWHGGMSCASRGGRIEIVELMISRGANNWNNCMINACFAGHVEIVKLMIDHGADNWNKGMLSAIREGHMDIVKLMIDHGANNLNKGLTQSCFRGYIPMMELMIVKGASIDIAYTDLSDSSIERLVKQGVKSFGKYTKVADKYRCGLSCVELVLANKMCKDLARLCSTY